MAVGKKDGMTPNGGGGDEGAKGEAWGSPFSRRLFSSVSSSHGTATDLPGTVKVAGPKETAGIAVDDVDAGETKPTPEAEEGRLPEEGYPPAILRSPLPCFSPESDGDEQEAVAVVTGSYHGADAPDVPLQGGWTRTPNDGVTCTPAAAGSHGTPVTPPPWGNEATPYGVARAFPGHKGIPTVGTYPTPAEDGDGAGRKTCPPA